MKISFTMKIESFFSSVTHEHVCKNIKIREGRGTIAVENFFEMAKILDQGEVSIFRFKFTDIFRMQEENARLKKENETLRELDEKQAENVFLEHNALQLFEEFGSMRAQEMRGSKQAVLLTLGMWGDGLPEDEGLSIREISILCGLLGILPIDITQEDLAELIKEQLIFITNILPMRAYLTVHGALLINKWKQSFLTSEVGLFTLKQGQKAKDEMRKIEETQNER